ncbi:non-functional NADPH-dependent codeinone reductase 2-like [Humulus lupulus]|uniref:non-functional NADPH-dependent codeinone reductase 2-like n=1 Tax=Humulus lupulus TaxID=3486 RepID=UPI002B40865E|nr:non-functional NADPH-dependent codeinone reductase 2-like [Humulus lupulus]
MENNNNIPEMKVGLSREKTIPVIGFGTSTFPLISSETTKEAILGAIKHGYRHFDTAAIYQTELPLGDAISEAISLGFIQSRTQLFVTSKLWCTQAHHHLVLPAIQQTLRNLRLDYLDLYLIHWPIAIKPGEFLNFKKEDFLVMDFKSVWESMEECQNLGLTKSIGVSNFSCKKLETLLATAKIPPAVNQVEMNPVWQQKKLRKFCEENGILITAYSPLGGDKEGMWATNRVMDCVVLKEIANAKGKTIAQICLRWLYEQGVCFVVKSFDKERMKQNIDIFEWNLSTEELEKIEQIPQQKGNPAISFISNEGPYKSVEEFWDGEI